LFTFTSCKILFRENHGYRHYLGILELPDLEN